jgi:hypothetical protein
MAPPTADALVRELGTRMQQFAPATPQPGALATTLIDPGLRQYMPNDVGQLNAWVYAGADSDPANVGLERRASSWTALNNTLTFYSPGWPVAPIAGQFEINFRFPRSRLLEAINSGVGELGLTWYREVTDETVVTADRTWRYSPAAVQNWALIRKVEIQINTDNNLVGYPFVDASYLNWRPRRQVDLAGNETWFIEFGILPPIGRILRVFGEAFYPDLVADTDVLAIAGNWMHPAKSWLYSYAQYQLNDWSVNGMMTTEVEKVRQKSLDQLERAKEKILALAPAHKPGRIITPGRGDGSPIESPEDGSYLGIFRSAGFSH